MRERERERQGLRNKRLKEAGVEGKITGLPDRLLLFLSFRYLY